MKILLTGAGGQVGFELAKKLNELYEVIATDREVLDLVDSDAISAFIDEVNPDIIINPAAYTAVDKAESEPELAHQINAIAPGVLAKKAHELDIPMIQFSTDYVFDGFKKEAYRETDQTNPLSVYGKTKYEGEAKVRQYKKHMILRTSWVFGSHGDNFLKTILRAAQEKDSLHIVSDQWGSPSSAHMLADVTSKLVHLILKDKHFNAYGTYHVTGEGETNWHLYGQFIVKEAIQLGCQIQCDPGHIYPINTLAYPKPAKRPMNSRLDCERLKKTFMLALPHWQDEVKKVLKDIV